MLGHLVDHAKLRLTIATTHYGGRALYFASLAVAGAFGLAAVFIVIAERAGPVVACIAMAGAFLLLAMVLAFTLSSREQTQRLALNQAAGNSAMAAGLMAVMPGVLSRGRRAVTTSRLASPLVLGSLALVAFLALRGRTSSGVNDRV